MVSSSSNLLDLWVQGLCLIYFYTTVPSSIPDTVRCLVIFLIELKSVQFSSVQSSSRVRFFATPWIAAHQASLSITNSRSSPRLMSIESVMPSSHLILCRPLLLLLPIPPSIRVFSNESTLCMTLFKSLLTCWVSHRTFSIHCTKFFIEFQLCFYLSWNGKA